jgi:hypothetical protein
MLDIIPSLFRSGEGDKTMPQARAAAAGRAGPWPWRGRRRACRAEPAGRAACMPGRNGKGFTTFFNAKRFHKS